MDPRNLDYEILYETFRDQHFVISPWRSLGEQRQKAFKQGMDAALNQIRREPPSDPFSADRASLVRWTLDAFDERLRVVESQVSVVIFGDDVRPGYQSQLDEAYARINRLEGQNTAIFQNIDGLVAKQKTLTERMNRIGQNLSQYRTDADRLWGAVLGEAREIAGEVSIHPRFRFLAERIERRLTGHGQDDTD